MSCRRRHTNRRRRHMNGRRSARAAVRSTGDEGGSTRSGGSVARRYGSTHSGKGGSSLSAGSTGPTDALQTFEIRPALPVLLLAVRNRRPTNRDQPPQARMNPHRSETPTPSVGRLVEVSRLNCNRIGARDRSKGHRPSGPAAWTADGPPERREGANLLWAALRTPFGPRRRGPQVRLDVACQFTNSGTPLVLEVGEYSVARRVQKAADCSCLVIVVDVRPHFDREITDRTEPALPRAEGLSIHLGGPVTSCASRPGCSVSSAQHGALGGGLIAPHAKAAEGALKTAAQVVDAPPSASPQSVVFGRHSRVYICRTTLDSGSGRLRKARELPGACKRGSNGRTACPSIRSTPCAE
jgi:hypothetical protein